jgi:hypothetical protein
MTDANPPRPVIGRIEQLTTREVDALRNDLSKELDAAIARGPLVIDTREKAEEWARNLVRSARWDEGFGERRVADADDQPGACAPVPLPEPDITVVTTHAGIGIRGHSDRAMRAYGEACAAHWRDIALRATDQAQKFKIAMKSAERERDELRARAEAAEAKIAEMGG